MYAPTDGTESEGSGGRAKAMASHRAIRAVADAIVLQLGSHCCPPDLGSDLSFQVYGSREFSDRPIANGASLFVYRVVTSGAHRTPP